MREGRTRSWWWRVARAVVPVAVAAASLALVVWMERASRPPHPDERGAALTGTVYVGGAPAAARVELHRWPADGRRFHDGEPMRVAVAGADGRFEFDDLASRVVEVRAVAPGYASGRARVAVGVVHAHATVEVLAGSSSLRGRVERASGGRFRGVVLVRPAGAPSVPRTLEACGGAVVEPDADGRFSVHALPEGLYDVEAYHPPSGAYVRVRAPAPGPSVELDVTAHIPCRLRGRVVDAADGTPVPDAEVAVARGLEAESAEPPTTHAVDADGAFDLLVFESSSHGHSIVVRAPAVRRATLRWTPGDDEVRVALARGAVVEGRVVGPDGVGVRGVDVVVTSVGPRSASWSTTTVDGGAFHVRGLAPGEVHVVARGRGWHSAVAGGGAGQVLRLGPDDVRHLALSVAPARTWRVRVVDARGRAVGRARVEVVPLERAPTAGAAFGRGDWAVRAVTGADGRAELPDVPAASAWTVRVVAPDGRVASRDVTGESDEVDVVLDDARFVTVRLRDAATGAPLRGQVHAVDERGRRTALPGFAAAWTVRRGGEIVGPLPVGRTWLVARADGYLASLPAAVAGDDATEISLARAVWLRGFWEASSPRGTLVPPEVRVVASDGTRRLATVSGATWTCATDDPRPHRVEAVLADGTSLWRGVSAATPGDPPRPLSLAPVPEGIARVAVGGEAVVADGRRVVVLQRGTDGRVRRTAYPLDAFAGADVAVDPRGGPWWVDAAPALSDAATAGPPVQGPFDAARRSVVLERWPRSFLVPVRVRVTTERGVGVAGARVRARLASVPAAPDGEPYDDVACDGTGTAEVRLPEDGAATLTARVPAPYAPPDPISRVSSPGGARELRVVPGVERVVEVRRADGAPAVGAVVAVSWTSPDGVESDHADGIGAAPFVTGPDGTVVVPRLLDGRRYRVEADPPPGVAAGRAVATLDPAADVPTVVTLPAP